MRKLLLLLVVMLLATMVVSAQDENYTVQRGDTLQSIANRFGVDVDAILIRNNIINPNHIQAGQRLIIPHGTVQMPRSHVVAHGENMTDIATRYQTTVVALQEANLIANPNMLVPGQVLRIPAGSVQASSSNTSATQQPAQTQATVTAPTYRTYVVQPRDMISYIALEFGTTAEAIRQLNGITNSRLIYAGDVLLIPPPSGNVAPPPPRHMTGQYYTVQAGDTLFEIAASFHVNLYDIAQANGILNLNSIYAGQPLLIPGR